MPDARHESYTGRESPACQQRQLQVSDLLCCLVVALLLLFALTATGYRELAGSKPRRLRRMKKQLTLFPAPVTKRRIAAMAQFNGHTRGLANAAAGTVDGLRMTTSHPEQHVHFVALFAESSKDGGGPQRAFSDTQRSCLCPSEPRSPEPI